MRTPRLLLGVFALALLLPLLLLACGGSDEPTDRPARATAEPTDMPDSERATAEPTDMARLTTSHRRVGHAGLPPHGRLPRQGQGDAPTATDAPRPTATRPPLHTIGPTSAKTDRDALVALYNATNGEDWIFSYNWLSDAAPRPMVQRHHKRRRARYRAGTLGQRLEREDTGGAGQPLKPDRAEPQPQRLEREATGGAGQPLKPDRAEPQPQPT